MIKRHKTNDRMGQAVRYGGVLYLSRQVLRKAEGRWTAMLSQSSP